MYNSVQQINSFYNVRNKRFNPTEYANHTTLVSRLWYICHLPYCDAQYTDVLQTE